MWNTIDSAPKDGSEILVWRSDCGILIAKWSCPAEEMTQYDIEETDLDEDQLFASDWFSDYGGWMNGGEAPTHWMPLPAEPDVTPRVTPQAQGEASDDEG